MHDLRRRPRRFNLPYFWPVLGIAAIVILWTLVNARLTKEYNDARITAFAHAIATAKAYSEQLSHTVNLYDQITMTTKFNCEKSDGLFRLEDYADAGIYPTSKSLFVNIVDRNGQMVTSTLPFTRPDY